MCFLRNPHDMANFIAALASCHASRTPVFVNVRKVVELELNAVAVLLAAMVRFKAAKIRFNGNMPDEPAARSLLVQSGFLRHLQGTYSETDAYDLVGPTIHTHGNPTVYTHGKLTVDSEFSQKLIYAASKTVWGESRRCPGLQRTFIELMQNTNNHASPDQRGEKHWWISAHHIETDNRVVFSFVDFGVGVFESLAKKPTTSRFFGAIETLKARFRKTTNAEVLGLILKGELHKTTTGRYYRGKGLPGIYGVLKSNRISKLAMVTNNVFFNSEGMVFRTLDTGFGGTLISWELNSDNESLTNED